MPTDDRRVRRTKKALRESLAELMVERELRMITIRELTNKADVHRATFYAHYTDIYDLYAQMENEIFEELGAIIVVDLTHRYDDALTTIIEYACQNPKTCRMFLSQRGNQMFSHRFSHFLEDKYAEIWRYETGGMEPTEEWRYLVRYHMQGCIALISRWAEENYTYPKDKLIEALFNVDNNFDSLLYG